MSNLAVKFLTPLCLLMFMVTTSFAAEGPSVIPPDTWARAEKGDKDAEYSIGEFFHTGKVGTKAFIQDDREAARWWQRSAEQGNSAAQNALGNLYRDGQGVTQDYIIAAKWYSLSAQQDNKEAKVNLGKLYHEGLGVKQSNEEAYFWLLLSNKRSFVSSYSKTILEQISKSLTHQQIATVQLRVKEWEKDKEFERKIRSLTRSFKRALFNPLISVPAPFVLAFLSTFIYIATSSRHQLIRILQPYTIIPVIAGSLMTAALAYACARLFIFAFPFILGLAILCLCLLGISTACLIGTVKLKISQENSLLIQKTCIAWGLAASMPFILFYTFLLVWPKHPANHFGVF